jgi:hypothetical protein
MKNAALSKCVHINLRKNIFKKSVSNEKLSVVQNTRGFKNDLHNIKIKLVQTNSTISIKSNVEKFDQI